jgi:endo-1,4-beta-xylanase
MKSDSLHPLSKLALVLATGGLLANLAGCSEAEPQTQPHGTGGSTVVGVGGNSGSGGVMASGGKSGSGGDQTGGSKGSGGQSGTGGDTGSGGATGNGGSSGGSKDAGSDTAGGGRGDAGTPPGTGGVVGSDARTAADSRPGAGGNSGTGGTTPPSTGPLKKWFGNIDTRGSIRSDFASMWDQFSAENAGKWGSVQGGGQTSFNWSSLDKMYKYCEDNHIVFKEHCFIWGSQQPSWVNNSNGEAAVKAWMKAFCERYPNTRVIDVVNEPLHPQPAYKEGIGGAGSSGWDWIVNALKWAKEACPNAILVVNDYNTIEYSSENGRIISLVNAVKKAGGPIDAVGCQSHDIAKVSQSTMTSYGQKIIDQTGLPIHVTEMDIGIADDNQQMQRMKEFVTWGWENPKVTGMTYWGYIVGATWRSNTGLMTDSGSKRPALTWLLDYLGR